MVVSTWCYHGAVEEEETRLTVRLPRRVAEALRELAQQDRRSLNAEIVVALEQYVAGRQGERGKSGAGGA